MLASTAERYISRKVLRADMESAPTVGVGVLDDPGTVRQLQGSRRGEGTPPYMLREDQT